VTRKPLDLMGAAEIGHYLKVSRQRVQQIVSTPTFPTPASVLGMGKVWLSADVRTWAAQHRPELAD
jgi:predicted DNA-binding transcriptional regulator AlpA